MTEQTVKHQWGFWLPLAVSVEELGALLNAEKANGRIAWKSKGLILHAVTPNEWAYRMVAEIRKEPF